MLKTKRFLLFTILYTFNLLLSLEPIDYKPSLVDLSVYDGEGSLLLLWSYPDSILAENTKIYSRQSSQITFNLVTELSGVETRYLDLDCQPNIRIFYKVEITDINGEIYSSDFNVPSFGACLEDNNSTFALNYNSSSFKEIAIDQILNMLTLKDKTSDFSYLSEILKYEYIEKENWLNEFPAYQLKDIDESVKRLHNFIESKAWIDSLSLKKSYFSNHLLLTPPEWETELQLTIQNIIQETKGLYPSYLDALEFLNKVKPIKIVKYNLSEEFGKTLSLYLFDRQKILSEEVYLLSNEEYINVNDYKLLDSSVISINIPMHWNEVKLMINDSVLQTCGTIFDTSIMYTIENDIIPNDSNYVYKIDKSESKMWMNEIIWNSTSKSLQVEIAGEMDYKNSYSIFINGKSIWDIKSFNSFDIKYNDSSFTLDDLINLPLTVEFKRFNAFEDQTLEYIIIDTLSFMKSRMFDAGEWIESEITTLGSSNKNENALINSIALPKSFILYQNYPNPFNGETRITFDLLEDAIVSLYVTDAKGRIQDKFIDNEYISSGNYNFNWEGENKSTGIYFFTIYVEVKNNPPTVLSRKMIYLK